MMQTILRISPIVQLPNLVHQFSSRIQQSQSLYSCTARYSELLMCSRKIQTALVEGLYYPVSLCSDGHHCQAAIVPELFASSLQIKSCSPQPCQGARHALAFSHITGWEENNKKKVIKQPLIILDL